MAAGLPWQNWSRDFNSGRRKMENPEILKAQLRIIQQDLDKLNAENVLLEMEIALVKSE